MEICNDPLIAILLGIDAVVASKHNFKLRYLDIIYTESKDA